MGHGSQLGRKRIEGGDRGWRCEQSPCPEVVNGGDSESRGPSEHDPPCRLGVVSSQLHRMHDWTEGQEMKLSRQGDELKEPRARPRWARIETHDDRVVVSCSDCNFVDAARVERLHKLLVGVMTPKVKTVELDLRQVDGADTKLVAALVAAARSSRDCRVRLILHTSPHIRDLIRLCRLQALLGNS